MFGKNLPKHPITFSRMISVEQALKLVSSFKPEMKVETRPTADSLGQVLANDVLSPINMPPFPQSAMDGYALGSGERVQGSSFRVIGEIAAGSSDQLELGEGECVRIFTGAPVPESALAVVQQEWIEGSSELITLEKEVKERMHIRPMGEQMKASDVALSKCTLITPAAVGFISMLGITEVEVFAKPKVEVLVTGDELAKPGETLAHGQIFESNSYMLISALEKERIRSESFRIPDDLTETVNRISEAISSNDVVIISGGISVGDHDHVGTALNQLGVEEVFYKVKQKPGKPLLFGTKNGTAIFALPGNPAASLSCFYMYVLPILRKFLGRSDQHLDCRNLSLSHDFMKKGDRAVFLKARVKNDQVEILNDQSSAMLSSFAVANALVYLSESTAEVKARQAVSTFMLPV